MARTRDTHEIPSGRGSISQLQQSNVSRRELLQWGAALGIGGAGMATGSPVVAAPSRRILRQGDPATLTIVLDGSPADLDPHSQYEVRSTLAVRGPYDGLIALEGSATNEYKSLIAERWEANDDQSVWTFHLRPGVTFQDGSPCDAEAVRASYERLLTMQRGAFNVVARFVTDPAMVTAPDPQTVVFELGRPQPLLPAALASTYGPQIVNVKVAREHEEDGDWGNTWLQSNAEGTGTGPYRIVEFEVGDHLIMERYDDYWGGWEGNHFDRIVVRVVEEAETTRQLIERGEADVLDRLSTSVEAIRDFEQNPDLKVDRQTTTEVEYYIMTVGGQLETPEARQAMCWAFPYQEVIDQVYLGYAKQASGPVGEKLHGFAPETFQYHTDLAKAKELFAAAGVPEGTELRLMVRTGSGTTIPQLMQANLEQVGMRLAIEEVESATYSATIYGDAPAEERPNLMVWSWWPDYNDAWNHLYPQVSCDQWGSKGANGGYYCNERVEELLAEAKDAVDESTYETALAEVQQILSRDDPPAIYYAQPEWTTVLRQDVEGFVFNPINIGTYDLWELYRKA
jgi:peptide/nickel transport system substrate-binding protein